MSRSEEVIKMFKEYADSSYDSRVKEVISAAIYHIEKKLEAKEALNEMSALDQEMGLS